MMWSDLLSGHCHANLDLKVMMIEGFIFLFFLHMLNKSSIHRRHWIFAGSHLAAPSRLFIVIVQHPPQKSFIF